MRLIVYSLTHIQSGTSAVCPDPVIKPDNSTDCNGNESVCLGGVS